MIPLLALHLAGGAVAIGSGLTALYAAKGATLHRGSGAIFVGAMLSMSVTGPAVIASGGRATPANVLAGLLTTYLVITAVTTVSARSERVQRIDRGAMVAALTFGLVGIVIALGIFALAGPAGRGLAIALLIVGGVALPAGLGDRRMIRAGGLRSAPRLKRHLWRMCLALFIVLTSFVYARRVPEALRVLPIRLIPFVVPVTMSIWLWRLRRRRVSSGVTVAGLPEALS